MEPEKDPCKESSRLQRALIRLHLGAASNVLQFEAADNHARDMYQIIVLLSSGTRDIYQIVVFLEYGSRDSHQVIVLVNYGTRDVCQKPCFLTKVPWIYTK